MFLGTSSAWSQAKKSVADSTKKVVESKQEVKVLSDTLAANSVATSFQNTEPDSEVNPVSDDFGDSEIILGPIEIEAIIETPSVNIVPKRIDPEMGKMEVVDRSFEKELKAVPIKPMLMGKELTEINKIKKMKIKKPKTKQTK